MKRHILASLMSDFLIEDKPFQDENKDQYVPAIENQQDDF